MMHKAYECTIEFSRDGKHIIRRSRSIGPIVPCAIVLIIALLLGRAVITIPSSLLSLMTR